MDKSGLSFGKKWFWFLDSVFGPRKGVGVCLTSETQQQHFPYRVTLVVIGERNHRTTKRTNQHFPRLSWELLAGEIQKASGEGDGTENVINCKLSQIVATFYDEFYDDL